MMEPLSPPLPELVDFHCRTLLLHGAKSKPLSRENLARLAPLIPGARTAEVSNADHILSLDNPKAYAALIDEWVEEVAM
jgi:pimeloyl-ACP methyl ester carboxylesterase